MIKEKEGKRQGKKRLFDEARSRDLCPIIMVLPLGHEGSHALTLQKALI